jgi:hypothetical protein
MALLAAVWSQLLAELGPVPECRGPRLGLVGEPALARADLLAAGAACLLVGKPPLDVLLAHDVTTPRLARGRTGQPERAALGVAADGPARARVDHAATELAHTAQRRLEVIDLEVRE